LSIAVVICRKNNNKKSNLGAETLFFFSFSALEFCYLMHVKKNLGAETWYLNTVSAPKFS
jgi:hypothetical protein